MKEREKIQGKKNERNKKRKARIQKQVAVKIRKWQKKQMLVLENVELGSLMEEGLHGRRRKREGTNQSFGAQKEEEKE